MDDFCHQQSWSYSLLKCLNAGWFLQLPYRLNVFSSESHNKTPSWKLLNCLSYLISKHVSRLNLYAFIHKLDPTASCFCKSWSISKWQTQTREGTIIQNLRDQICHGSNPTLLCRNESGNANSLFPFFNWNRCQAVVLLTLHHHLFIRSSADPERTAETGISPCILQSTARGIWDFTLVRPNEGQRIESCILNSFTDRSVRKLLETREITFPVKMKAQV